MIIINSKVLQMTTHWGRENDADVLHLSNADCNRFEDGNFRHELCQSFPRVDKSGVETNFGRSNVINAILRDVPRGTNGLHIIIKYHYNLFGTTGWVDQNAPWIYSWN